MFLFCEHSETTQDDNCTFTLAMIVGALFLGMVVLLLIELFVIAVTCKVRNIDAGLKFAYFCMFS